MTKKSGMRYYDPEYDRIVTEEVVRRQYNWFAKFDWFAKSFKEFAEENFVSERQEPNLEKLIEH